MKNKFPGWCHQCRSRVPAHAGTILGRCEITARWLIECATCRAATASPDRSTQWPKDSAGYARFRADQSHAPHQSAEDARRPEDSRRFIEDLQREIDRLRALEAARSAIHPCLRQLGVAPPVNEETIRQRFRELAKQCHPDHGGDASKFIGIRKAYQEALGLYGRVSV